MSAHNKWLLARRTRRSTSPSKLNRARAGLRTERLEDRTMPAIFAVTNLNDSGVGSLRQAILDANGSGGADTIQFNVSGTINVLSALPSLTDVSGGTTIDGRTAPGYSSAPVVVLHGPGSLSSVTGLTIKCNNNSVWALQIDSFATGIDVSGVATSTGVNGNVVAGNYIGTNGTVAIANGTGVTVQGFGSGNLIGGVLASSRNVISGNSTGIFLSQGNCVNNTIQGNYIGTNAAGTAAIANTTRGIYVNGSLNNTIGGNAMGAGNVISANGVGVYLDFNSNGQQIINNLIGTKADGVGALGNSGVGVQVFFCSNNTIRGNTIAFNNNSGVVVSINSSAGNLIRSNSIFSNTRLGIDLAGGSDPANGVTPNDVGDVDSGPNGLQNYPVLTGVTASAGSTVVTGTLNSVANKTYTIEFFSSPTADPSTFGEGATPLGTISVTTDGSGNASFSATLAAVAGGSVITATATDPTNNTSEFSQRITVNGNPNIGVSDVTVNEGNSGTTAAVFTVSLSATPTSTLTVNYATADGSAQAGSDYQATSGVLTFNPGDVSQTVTVLVNGDTTYETNEQFYLNLSGAVNGTITDSQGIGTITNDDVQPSASVNDVQVQEPSSGTTSAVFTISLSQASAVTAQVSYATADGTATAGTDYVATSGQATFLAGQTSATVSVTILGGQQFVGSRTFTLNLSNPSNAIIADGVGVGTINASNNPPVANNDSATTNEDTPVTIDVTANDSDPDGDSVSIVGFSQGAHGSVEFVGGGSVKYSPAFNFNGSDSFNYTIDDGHGQTAMATVFVTVNPVNDPPIAGGNTATTDENMPVTVNVLANDFDFDGDTLSVSAVTQGAHGSVVINANNTVTYTPGANFNGSDSFTYTADDSHGGTATASVSVTVNPVNQPPVANDDTATTNEDTPVTINVTANDTDDDGEAVFVIDVTQGTHGSVVIAGPGSVQYSPAFNFNGTDTFTYTIDDGHGQTDTATVTVTVTPVNDPPIAGGNTAVTDEDNAVNVDVLANDFDFDGDTLTVSAVTQGAHGSVVINANNTVKYTPAPNFNGSDSFTYTADDGHGGTATASVSVTVNPVNDAPVANDDAATTDEDTPATISVLANDTDVDGDTLSVFSVTQGANGSVVINLDNTVTYSPVANFNGTDSFSYTVDDGHGGTATANVSVTVNAVNDAPVITSGDLNLSATTINEAGSVTLSGSFTDVEAGQTHTVVINWGDGSGNTTFNLAAGVTTFGPVGHTYGDNGLFGISVGVTDSDGASGSAGKNVTVNNVAPTASLSGPATGIPGQARSFSFSATDVSAADTAAGFQFTVNWGDGSSQSFTGGQTLDHAYATTGNFTVQVTATDKDGGVSAAATQVITVSNIALEQDPTDASKWAIFVGGTAANDNITFRAGNVAGQVVAQMQSGGTTTIGTFTPAGGGATFTVTVNGATTVNMSVAAPATLARVIAFGNAGDDNISVAKNGPTMLAVPAYLFGGNGNDNLDAGGSSGNNVLVGEAGSDKLFGGSGRDILIGGVGDDTLRAGDNGSIMIGESTDYDSNIGALTALLAEWGGGSSYNVRVGHLQGQPGGVNGAFVLTNATVHSDGVSDDLFGGAGLDWFFARTSGGNADKIKKLDAGETVTLL